MRSAAGVCKGVYSDVMPPLVVTRRVEVKGIGITCNPSRLAEFKHRFNHYGCDVTLFELRNARASYWQVEERKSGARQGSSFDSDMLVLLSKLRQGHKLEHISLIPCGSSSVVKSTADGPGPHCAVCDTVGGLPCPKMLKTAIQHGLKLALTPAQMEANSFHVHPGRCRKRLHQLLDTCKAGVAHS